MELTLEQFGIDRLDHQQRCELIGLIWDSLPPDGWSPPEWHWAILDKRIEAADANPDSFEPYDQVLDRLSNKS